MIHSGSDHDQANAAESGEWDHIGSYFFDKSEHDSYLFELVQSKEDFNEQHHIQSSSQ